jgi:hypothetical protein
VEVEIRTWKTLEGTLLPEDWFRWWSQAIDARGSVLFQTGPHLSRAGAQLRARRWTRRHGYTMSVGQSGPTVGGKRAAGPDGREDA